MITMLAEKADVVARKDYSCDLCRLAIGKGTAHYTQRNADSGSMWTWRAHTRCYGLLGAYWKWSGIDQRYVDEYDVIPDDEFRQFSASHKDRDAG